MYLLSAYYIVVPGNPAVNRIKSLLSGSSVGKMGRHTSNARSGDMELGEPTGGVPSVVLWRWGKFPRETSLKETSERLGQEEGKRDGNIGGGSACAKGQRQEWVWFIWGIASICSGWSVM